MLSYANYSSNTRQMIRSLSFMVASLPWFVSELTFRILIVCVHISIWIDGWMDRWMDRWMDTWIYDDIWIYGYMDIWIDG